jgi:dCMP deaminase
VIDPTTDRPTWDQIWLATAQVVASRSRCDRAQVGAVIVTRDNRVAAVSYNGPPRGQQLTGTCRSWCPRARVENLSPSYDECATVHAEANGLLLNEISIRGGTIYISSACCRGCAKLIANSGLGRVVHVVGPGDKHRDPDTVESYLRECGLTVVRANRVEEL